MAGEVADGIHVHPMHSMHYITNRLLPGVAEGAKRAGRDPKDVDLIIYATLSHLSDTVFDLIMNGPT